MSESVIRVENLGKRYRIRHQQQGQRYVALRDVLASTLTSPLRWFRRGGPARPGTEDFWALKDVSFDVAQGAVVGIIGRNGAGKSTLLKILSRITEPTEGRVTLCGRVASLLEVGTGFHPELTGRENIFLNGAILGMSRAEINRKFDEIVAFAEVETFLDTPVKRYSSGMYMRLAFAVAAHLEPEVLVVDEVLAVGDAEFQKKCLGKMRDVSQGGRTVLFVSHNMAAVGSLTSRAIVLNRGRVVFEGPSVEAVAFYSGMGRAHSPSRTFLGRGPHTAICRARLLNELGEGIEHYVPGTPLRVEVVLETDGSSSLSLEAFLVGPARQKLGMASLHHFHGLTLPDRAGQYTTVLALAPVWLASGTYTIDIATSIINSHFDHYVEDAVEFDVVSSNPGGRAWDFRHNLGYGALALPCLQQPEFVSVTAGN
ncbi:MAG: ABC transporter ATP-binding protein [Acidobacteriota bacterium]|nr:ABC transporter ATP-binding protein [Acidobacteriota bacterium]